MNDNIQIYQRMLDQFRNTGKFKPIQNIIQHNFTTAAIIKVPQHKVRSIQWRRKCQEFQQIMYHLNNSFEYLCSELDKDCIIQAFIDYQSDTTSVEARVNVYGPISLPSDNNFLLENIYNEGEQFQIQIIRKNCNYQCQLSASNNQLYLKSKTNLNGRQFFILMSDVVACYVDRTQNQQVVVFPTVYLRLIGLKLFNQIIYKGTYSENNDPVKIKVVDPNVKLRPNLKWKRLLLKLNHMKHDYNRRASQLSSHASKKNSTPFGIPSNQVKNNDINIRKNQDSNVLYGSRKDSQTIKNDVLKKSSNFLQSEGENVKSNEQYFEQFQDLIYDDNKSQKDELALNDSFEKFQKQTKSQKQMEKILYIKAKKKQREDLIHKTKRLKQKYEQLAKQKEQLLIINAKLRNQTENMSSNSADKNHYEAINQAKIQIRDLKMQYERLFQQTNRKSSRLKQVQGRYSSENIVNI